MIKIKVNNFNLKDTVTCGQIFRFIEENDSFIIILSIQTTSFYIACIISQNLIFDPFFHTSI